MTGTELVAKSENLKEITQDFRVAVENFVKISRSQVDMIRKATKNNGIEGNSTPEEIRKKVEEKLKDAEKQLANLDNLSQELKSTEEKYSNIITALRNVGVV